MLRFLAFLDPFLRKIPLGTALLETASEGYDRRRLVSDIVAGMVVGIIALPLSMALAIATGLAPQYGLYTAIVAGALIALTGGSKVQVSGPTAAFVVILVPIVTKFGLGGLLLATLMAGCFLVLFGVLRLGRLIEFVPSTVTTGFTAGIAVVLASLQLKDFMGLQTGPLPEDFFGRLSGVFGAIGTLQSADLFIGLMTLVTLLVVPMVSRKLPAPLVALTAAALTGVLLEKLFPGTVVETINTRFSYVVDGEVFDGIPRQLPLPALPWTLPGPQGAPLELSWDLIRSLAPSAFAIAMLGAIESLLSAIVSDGMSGNRHDPDAELVAQGVGNVVAPFFGGFAATGAIARTAANVRAGATSPVAAIAHAVFVLAAIVLFAPMLGYLPMAALAALLLQVAWNMSETRYFIRFLKVAPRSDILVLLTCFSLTVIFDMVIAVTAGVVLAALMFMRRMAEVFDVKIVRAGENQGSARVPKGVALYEVAGPLFFGAAQKAMSQLQRVDESVHTVIIDMTHVPALDSTAFFNLESTLEQLHLAEVRVILVNVQPQPAKTLEKVDWFEKREKGLFICEGIEEALRKAGEPFVRA